MAFDLLYLNGYDLRKLPLIERKTHLKKIIDGSDVHFRQSFEVDGKEMFAHACKVGLETLRKNPALTKPRRAVHLQRWRTWVDLSQLAASLAMAPKFASVFAMSAGNYLPGFSDFAVTKCFCNVSIWPEAYSPAASLILEAFLYSAISF